jgi:23S rRNA (guanine745-N1)-methyltransferase
VHDEVVAALRCPVDRARFVRHDRTLRCEAGHAFDLARQGYVNLLRGRDPGTGDGAAMVAARERVLGAGRFAAISDALADAVALGAAPDGLVVDVGAGTGHHLAVVLDRLPGRIGLALDLSRYAARRAARCHDRADAVVADAWQPLPLGDEVAGAVTCVFAPRAGAELARILRRDGVLVVVTPAADHLGELVATLDLLRVDDRKRERLHATLAPHLAPAGPPRAVRTRLELSRDEVEAVVAMGPSADHLDTDQLRARVADLADPVAVTLAVELATFRRT